MWTEKLGGGVAGEYGVLLYGVIFVLFFAQMSKRVQQSVALAVWGPPHTKCRPPLTPPAWAGFIEPA